MAGGEIRDQLLISTASVSQVPIGSVHVAGSFVTDSGGTMASDWRLKTNLLRFNENR